MRRLSAPLPKVPEGRSVAVANGEAVERQGPAEAEPAALVEVAQRGARPGWSVNIVLAQREWRIVELGFVHP